MRVLMCSPSGRSGALFAYVLLSCLGGPAQVRQSALTGTGIHRARADWDYDGSRVLGHLGTSIYLWDAQTGRLLQRLIGHQEEPNSIQFSPDLKYALSSSGVSSGEVCGYHLPNLHSKDTSVRLWNLRTGQQILRLNLQVAGTFSPDGKRLLTYSLEHSPDIDCAGGDTEVVLWDIPSGRRITTVMPHHMSLSTGTMAFSPNGQTFICFLGRSLVVYSADNGTELARFDTVESFNFYGKDGAFATLSSKTVTIRDSKGRIIRTIPFAMKGLWAYTPAWASDGTVIAGIVVDTTQTSLEHSPYRTAIINLDPRHEYLGPDEGPGFLAVSPDNAHFIITRPDHEVAGTQGTTTVEMHNLSDGAQIWTIHVHSFGGILGFAPDGTSFITGTPVQLSQEPLSFIEPIRVYDSASGNQLSEHLLLDSDGADITKGYHQQSGEEH